MKKKSKRLIKYKIIFILIMITIGITISYKKLEKSKTKITNKEYISIITNNMYKEDNIIERLWNKVEETTNPIKKLKEDYQKYLTKEIETPVSNEIKTPVIYLYNTHDKEEYKETNYVEFSINPTVIMNNYILEDIFEKKGYETIVEESSPHDILTKNNWNYASSYKASRMLLENSIIKYPTLKYFIDIHRDSVERSKSTITIDNKDYAKLLFLIGLENDNYEKNLSFTEKINNKLNEYYPGLSKGIYKKSGPGVNGVYNQDFSEYTILLEVGGYENTTTEVLNSCIAFARCFMEIINE